MAAASVFGERPAPGKAVAKDGVDYGSLHGVLDRHVHPTWRLDRTERLLLKVRKPTIPHEDRSPCGIDDGRRVPTQLRHAVADPDRQSIAPTKAWAVAARTGLRRGDRDGYRNTAFCR